MTINSYNILEHCTQTERKWIFFYYVISKTACNLNYGESGKVYHSFY